MCVDYSDVLPVAHAKRIPNRWGNNFPIPLSLDGGGFVSCKHRVLKALSQMIMPIHWAGFQILAGPEVAIRQELRSTDHPSSWFYFFQAETT